MVSLFKINFRILLYFYTYQYFILYLLKYDESTEQLNELMNFNNIIIYDRK